MLFLRSFINFFMVPVITLVIFYSRKREELKPNFELLITYSTLVVLNIPLTRVFTFVAKFVIGKNIEADSSYYTICGILAAVTLAVGWENYLKAKAKAKDRQENSEDMDESEESEE